MNRLCLSSVCLYLMLAPGTATAQGPIPACERPPGRPGLTACHLERAASGELVLWVDGTALRPDDSIILINGRPCRRNYYPKKYQSQDGLTTRIGCSGNLASRLPGTVTVLNVTSGCVEPDSLQCTGPSAESARATGPN